MIERSTLQIKLFCFGPHKSALLPRFGTQNNEILLEIYHVPGEKELENYLILLKKSAQCMQSCSETILARLIIKNLEFKV